MTSSAPARMTTGDWALLALMSVLFGAAFLLIEVVVRDLPPFSMVLGRVGVAAMLLAVYARLRGHRFPAETRVWGSFLIIGTLNNIAPFSLIAWGEMYIDSGLAGILIATMPLFTCLLLPAMSRDERMTPAKVAGVLTGFLGVVVLMGPDVLRGAAGSILGQVLVLGAAFGYAAAGVYSRRLKDLPPVITTTGSLIGSTVLTLPVVVLVDRPWTLEISAVTWGALLALAVFSTALAYLLYFGLVARSGALSASLVAYLVPVSAVILGVLVLGEEPRLSSLAGMLVIFAGLAVIDGRLLGWLRRGFPSRTAMR